MSKAYTLGTCYCFVGGTILLVVKSLEEGKFSANTRARNALDKMVYN